MSWIKTRNIITETHNTPIDGINEIPKTKDFNENCRTAEEIVAHLMEKYPYTRKDYGLLWLMHLKEKGIAEIYIDVKKYMKSFSPTTLNRVRRKIFESAREGDKKGFYKEFLESDEEYENKKINEKEYKKYFRK